MEILSDFEFDFGGEDRAALLAEAADSAGALDLPLGDRAEEGRAAPSSLLTELNQEIAKFGAFPDVIELQAKHFTDHGLGVPKRFLDLNKSFRFFWLRLPITLSPLERLPFTKLECAIEFNPRTDEAALRPRAQLILPHKKFQQILEVNGSVELRIGESFDFEAVTEKLEAQTGVANVKASAGVEARQAAHLGVVAGPFTYRMKRAILDHSPAGTEKVFWRVSGADFFATDDPTIVVVAQVPRQTKELRIAAALQVYHHPNLRAAGVARLAEYLRERVATFLKKGAPLQDVAEWDASTALREPPDGAHGQPILDA
jgi:hypothetical protein